MLFDLISGFCGGSGFLLIWGILAVLYALPVFFCEDRIKGGFCLLERSLANLSEIVSLALALRRLAFHFHLLGFPCNHNLFFALGLLSTSGPDKGGFAAGAKSLAYRSKRPIFQEVKSPLLCPCFLDVLNIARHSLRYSAFTASCAFLSALAPHVSHYIVGHFLALTFIAIGSPFPFQGVLSGVYSFPPLNYRFPLLFSGSWHHN